MEALHYVHSKNVYYGDLKPHNLLVFRDMSVKFGDFGISVKIPDNADNSYKDYIKGITANYASKTAFKKYSNDDQFTF